MTKCKEYITNERGSGMLVLIIGMLIAAIFIAFIFFDFSNVFINKRVTQTGADAAALAAVKESGKTLKEDLRDETQDKLDDLKEAFEDFLEQAEDEGSEDEEEPKDLPSPDELLDDFISQVEAELGRQMPNDIKEWLKDSSVEVDANSALKFFFEEDEVSEIACKSVRDNISGAREAAERYAKENQNDRLVDIRFIPEDFRIYVETDRKGQYVTVSDDMLSPVKSESSARIGSPKGFTVSCD
jgi:Putative Flp pilus-assembly TadE/G-like